MLILTEGSFPWWTRLGLEYPELLTIALVAVFAVGSCRSKRIYRRLS